MTFKEKIKLLVFENSSVFPQKILENDEQAFFPRSVKPPRPQAFSPPALHTQPESPARPEGRDSAIRKLESAKEMARLASCREESEIKGPTKYI